jgi:hypothetical protein
MSHIIEVSTLVANVSLVLSLVVALVLGVVQAQIATRDRRERLTLETLRFVQTEEFAGFIYRINSGLIPATNEARNAMSAGDQIGFIQFAQQMESLGMLVTDGVIDLTLVERTLGSFVITAWDRYKPIFSELRQTGNDAYLGEYFQSLAELMERRLKHNPRSPAYKLVSKL